MPPARIPLRFTIQFRLDTVRAFRGSRLSQREFCRQLNIKRRTFVNWVKKESLYEAAPRPSESSGPGRHGGCSLEAAAAVAAAPAAADVAAVPAAAAVAAVAAAATSAEANSAPGQASVPIPRRTEVLHRRLTDLTLGGSGRVSKTDVFEDQIVVFIKNLRQEGCVVSRDVIIDEAKRLGPALFAARSYEASLMWCSRFMSRRGLSIRRISHYGRKARSDLEVLRVYFISVVVDLLVRVLFDPITRIWPKRVLFNMDQTSLYASVGSLTTVEFVGATTVPVLSGGDVNYRCTLAVTVCSDGRVFFPYFVFKGAPGGDVEAEVRGFVSDDRAVVAVQRNAWFDEETMLDWVDSCWSTIVSEPCLLILDSLKVHMSEAVAERLASYGTLVAYVPGGATGVAQPLDVGVMSPLKRKIRKLYSERYRGRPFPTTASERRRDMYERGLEAVESISADTVRNAFEKAGLFFPEGPAFSPPS